MAAEYKTETVLIQNGRDGHALGWDYRSFCPLRDATRPGAREITSSAISVGDGEGSAPLLLRTRIIKKESE
jgi:hypothetical protein